MTRQRPNFVFFITDQHRADFLGCYGHPLLKTPNIDRIARNGVAFDNFYVASPVCMPNRASLMTGRMPSVHGVRSNGIPLSRRNVTFVELLRDAGYATALVGKSHLQNFTGVAPLNGRRPPREGFHCPDEDLSQAVRTDVSGPGYDNEGPGFWENPDAAIATPYYGFDHVELVTGHGDDVGGNYRQWLLERDPDADRLLGADNQLPHDYTCPQAVRTALPEDLYSTSYISERSADYIRARKHGDEPFFLNVSFPDPHHPLNPPGRFWDMYRPEDMPVPEAFRTNDWQPPAHVRAVFSERDNKTANLRGMNTIAVSAREAQEAQALTCGMIAMLDEAIGTVLDALRESGEDRNTIIIFTSDHGDHLGDHRLFLKGAEPYREITRVPFIWYDPAAPGDGARVDALASTIDIPATILESARIEAFAGMQGRPLQPVIEGKAQDHRPAVLIQYDHQRPSPALNGPPRVHTIVERDWRLSLYHGVDWGELYDLTNDPGEFRNLWDSAEHAPQKARLLEVLARAEMDAADRIPLPIALA